MTEPSASRSDDDTERQIATLLKGAWSEYVALYGESPHGTFKQMHSMLALQAAGRKIIELCQGSPRSERPFIPEGWKLLKDTTFAERSYQEHLPHENGNYHCTCCECGRTFQAHKRTVICKVCATPSERNER